MDVFEFIDKYIKAKQLPYIRLITIYTNNGFADSVCLVRYNDKNIAKKASKLGLKDEKNLIEFKPHIQLQNIKPYDVSKGSFYLNYDTRKKDLNIFRM